MVCQIDRDVSLSRSISSFTLLICRCGHFQRSNFELCMVRLFLDICRLVQLRAIYDSHSGGSPFDDRAVADD